MTERDQLAQLLRDAVGATTEANMQGGTMTLIPSLDRMADFLLSKGVQLPLTKVDECGNYPEFGGCSLPKGHSGCCGTGGPLPGLRP